LWIQLLPLLCKSKPLCFDVPVPHKLRLLQDSSSEFSMNGESLSEQNGFHQIAIHYKTNHHLIISTKSISYHNGQDNVDILWGQELSQHNTDGVSLVVLENEMNVTMGNIGVVIISHKKDGVMFLWPAIWKYPKDVNLAGVLGKRIHYVDEFVFISEQMWRNFALHQLLKTGSSAVNGCRQNASSNS
uniref:Uncharacterized protein n=1 Tax=Sinocyclocheilus grahami TaxID=75366 RepID=A0A672KEC2_SINGR